ncbi:MAG: hypothetical protein MZV63_08740 [Marinilabiliales bacterium]|nr:hypothetical protein [Marinilabiliales bacterium]
MATRFLTDYIDGDNYYKIRYPQHNLQRNRVQHRPPRRYGGSVRNNGSNNQKHHKMKRSLLVILFAFFAVLTAYPQQPAAVTDSSKFSAYWWHSKDMYDHLPDTRNEIVFLGNSITDGAEWYELLGNKRMPEQGHQRRCNRRYPVAGLMP